LAEVEFKLKSFESDVNSTEELKAASSLALLALELKLEVIRENDAYAMAIVLDPELNKLLPDICSSTSWNFEKVRLSIF
jgi:hypothetical protein